MSCNAAINPTTILQPNVVIKQGRVKRVLTGLMEFLRGSDSSPSLSPPRAAPFVHMATGHCILLNDQMKSRAVREAGVVQAGGYRNTRGLERRRWRDDNGWFLGGLAYLRRALNLADNGA